MTQQLKRLAAQFDQQDADSVSELAAAAADMLIETGFLTIELNEYICSDGSVTTWRIYALTEKGAND